MRTQSILFLLLLGSFLLSCGFTMPAMACPPPDCGSCCYFVWIGPEPSYGVCVPNVGAECGDCKACSPCNSCVSCSCEWDCTPGQCCSGGTCVSSCPTGECCDDGVCVSACPGLECCSGGTCVTSCPTGQCCDDGTCETSCDGACESCMFGTCMNDQEKCPGTCDLCVSGECMDFDVLCTEDCKKCVDGDCVYSCSSGQCCSGDTCVTSCPSGGCCDGGMCVSSCPSGKCCDDGYCVSSCPGGECCYDGTCVSSCPEGECCDEGTCVVDCPTGKCCSGGICVSSCPSGECCDGWCYPPCVQTNTDTCNTSHNEDYPCPGCAGLILGPHCMDIPFREYTGNISHWCSGGCPLDCDWADDVLCYTEYECREVILRFGVCGLVEGAPYGVACREAGTYMFCVPCEKDTYFPGEEFYIAQKTCR